MRMITRDQGPLSELIHVLRNESEAARIEHKEKRKLQDKKELTEKLECFLCWPLLSLTQVIKILRVSEDLTLTQLIIIVGRNMTGRAETWYLELKENYMNISL